MPTAGRNEEACITVHIHPRLLNQWFELFLESRELKKCIIWSGVLPRKNGYKLIIQSIVTHGDLQMLPESLDSLLPLVMFHVGELGNHLCLSISRRGIIIFIIYFYGRFSHSYVTMLNNQRVINITFPRIRSSLWLLQRACPTSTGFEKGVCHTCHYGGTSNPRFPAKNSTKLGVKPTIHGQHLQQNAATLCQHLLPSQPESVSRKLSPENLHGRPFQAGFPLGSPLFPPMIHVRVSEHPGTVHPGHLQVLGIPWMMQEELGPVHEFHGKA